MTYKKILIITPYYEPVKGGITTFALNLKKEFIKRNINVLVITNRGETQNEVVSIEKNKFYFLIKSYGVMRKYKPEVIQSFSQWHILLPGVFYKMFHPKTKLIFTFNTEILGNFGFFKRKATNWLFSRCDTITFVSFYLKNEIEKKFDIRTKKKVIYDGCLLNPSYTETDILEFKDRFQIKDEERPIISTISVFAYQLKVKGLKKLIEAHKIITKTHPKAKLIIVGDGEYKDELTNLVEKLDLQNNVIFTGYMNNVFVPLLISDIYAHITLQEAGVAITILEAWAVNKPVIASNIGGIPEVVTNNVDGLIIEPDPLEISNSIIQLFNEPEKMLKFGKEGRKTLENIYTWENIATRFLNTYESI